MVTSSGWPYVSVASWILARCVSIVFQDLRGFGINVSIMFQDLRGFCINPRSSIRGLGGVRVLETSSLEDQGSGPLGDRDSGV